jgi:glucose/arabinose dehydrogenase
MSFFGAVLAAVASAAATPVPAPAPVAEPAAAVRLQAIGRFDQPLHVDAPPGDASRVFVVEQGGTIRIVKGGRVLDRPFLDVSDELVSGGEQGLLGLAFAPDYAQSRRFYVHYSAREDGGTRIVEYRASASDPDAADADSARLVLRQDQPEGNHNGGPLRFGPDRLLYIGLGDGGGGGDEHGRLGNGQSLSTKLGKILRIDPRQSGSRPYSVPAGNPFVNRRGAAPEIYAYGLRNPWRMAFDPATGDLAIADVGQSEIEEINFARRGRARGANYGWRVWEGRKRYASGETAPRHVPPVLQKSHANGWCSITGGVFLRDRSLGAGLQGRYVYGDFCLGQLRVAKLRAGRATNDRSLGVRRVENLSGFGTDGQGRAYVTSLAGPVYRLTR